jgi:methyltransferase-like protein/cyclopropane fatty-acyl-phospholipid synthase-like methyltransferase
MQSPTRYDEVAYPGHSYAQTHPDRIAAIAELAGFTPVPTDACRVLELGCGNGVNLIGMSLGLPNSEFVGIDLAERAIAIGQEYCAEVGAHNVTLQTGNLAALDPNLGQFDYIIAHGVYSWVPDEIQEALLVACKERLTKGGIAFVSFSAYPGAYSRALVREMMLFHTGGVSEPAAKVRAGIDFVRFVRETHGSDGAYAKTLDQELERITKGDPGYVFHDDFADVNTPVYFVAFAEQARARGLQFLAEASFSHFEDRRLSPEVRAKISELASSDVVAAEQYLDFIRGTAFRQSLLCHAEAEIKRPFALERLFSLSASASLRATSDSPDLTGRNKETFRSREGMHIETDEPLAKAALFALGKAWPDVLPVSRLLERAEELSGSERTSPAARALNTDILAQTLLGAAAARVVNLHQRAPVHAIAVGERPKASPLAQAQVRRGPLLTTLRHTSIRVEDMRARVLLTLADGTRNRAELLSALREAMPETPFTQAELEMALQFMAESALLLP